MGCHCLLENKNENENVRSKTVVGQWKYERLKVANAQASQWASQCSMEKDGKFATDTV